MDGIDAALDDLKDIGTVSADSFLFHCCNSQWAGYNSQRGGMWLCTDKGVPRLLCSCQTCVTLRHVANAATGSGAG